MPAGAGPVWSTGLAFAPEGGGSPIWSSLPPALAVLPEIAIARSDGRSFLDRLRGPDVGRGHERDECQDRGAPRVTALGAAYASRSAPELGHRDLGPLPAGALRGDRGDGGRADPRRRGGQGGARPRADRRGPGCDRPGRQARRAARPLPVVLLLLLRHAGGGLHRREPGAAGRRSGAVAATVALAGTTAAQRRPRRRRPPRRGDDAQPEGPRGARHRRAPDRAHAARRTRSGSTPRASRSWSRSETSSTSPPRSARSWPSPTARSSWRAILHPTPAIGGEPREPALALIDELEGIDRGWYTGPVGWMDAAEDGEFCVGAALGAAPRPRGAPVRGLRNRRRLRARRRASGVRAQVRGAAAAAIRLSSRCSSRFRAPDRCGTTIILASPASAASSSAGLSGSVSRQPEELRRSDRIEPARCARAAPRTRPRHRLRLRKEVEDAAAARCRSRSGGGPAAVAHGRRPPRSWKRARSPRTAQVRAPLPGGERRPTVETRPSMPLAPRFDAMRTPSGPGRRNASRSRTGMLEAARTESPSRSALAERGPDAGLAELVELAAGARRPPRARRHRHRASPEANGEPATALAPGRQTGQPLGQRARGRTPGRRGRSCPRAGSARATRRPGRSTICSRPSIAASHWRRGLLVGRSPTRTISSGSRRGRAVAGDVVVGGDHQRAVVRPAAELGGRLGEDRIAGGGSQGARPARQAPGPSGGRRRSGPRGADSIRSASRSSSASSARGTAADDRVQRRARRAPRAPAGRSRSTCTLARDRRERLAPGDVEVDRPGPRVAARRRRRRGRRPRGSAGARRHRPRGSRPRRTSAPRRRRA